MSENQEISSNSDAEFWRLVLESYQQSGLNVKQFCNREGISPSSFYNWQRRLTIKKNQTSEEVSQTESAMPEDIKARSRFFELGTIGSLPSQLRITFPSGICIHADDGCDMKLFREAITLLVEQRC